MTRSPLIAQAVAYFVAVVGGWLNRAAAVRCAFRCKIGRVRFFRCGKEAEMGQLAGDHYARLKFPLVPANTKYAEPVITACMALVFKVQAIVALAQIRDGVIRSVAVNVVNLVDRPPTVRMEPCQPVRFDPTISNLDDDVALTVYVAGDASGRNPPAISPDEHAGSSIVVEQRAKLVGGKIWISHAASSLGRLVRALTAFQRCGGSSILAERA